MKNSLFKYVLPGIMLVMLGFSGNVVFAQCDPLLEGLGTGDTFCQNQPLQFNENSAGYNANVTWDFGDGTSSVQKNPSKSYDQAGTYTATFTGTGGAGTCNRSFTIVINPSPIIDFMISNQDTQCFESNDFCFEDNTLAAPASHILKQTYLFSDGQRIDVDNPTFPHNFCYGVVDPTGGYFDVIIQSEDVNGCVSEITFADYFYVTPKLGIEFLNVTPPPNPGCDSVLGKFQNISGIDLSDVSHFTWNWGDGTIISGDSMTNTEWWDGPAMDGVVQHMYTENGTFDGSLTVTSDFGCTETYTWKSAVTNIVLKPVILSDKDSSCAADNPVNFWLKDGPPPGASRWLWNFGDPPSGPLNVNDIEWEVNHDYGTGPWMISLNVIVGPCNITVYDTIIKIGPGSVIEVAGDRVPEGEAYQCLITDSIHFPNNSSFYHNDPNPSDEDSFIYHYSDIVRVYTDPSTNFDSLQHARYEYGILKAWDNYITTDNVTVEGHNIYYDAGLDQIVAVFNSDTTYYPKNKGIGFNPKKRYKFNYQPPPIGGPQTAIVTAPMIANRGLHPHIWRVWSMGDQYAPQCTTDSRPWRNRNVGINCNWTLDTTPTHWYTPWDYVYSRMNNGAFYRAPYAKTVFHKTTRECYTVNIYPENEMIIPADTILTVPYGQSLTYMGVTIDPNTVYPSGKIGNWIIRRPPASFAAPKIYLDKEDSVFVVVNGSNIEKFDQWGIGLDTILGSLTWTVTNHDMEFEIPDGVKVKILDLTAAATGGAGTSRTVTGPKTETIKKDEQFTIYDGDSVYVNITVEENTPDTFYATASNYLQDTVIFGNPTTVTKSKVFIDPDAHREDFFLERAQCFTVQLWHKDTVHALACEGTGTKSLALTPPNARKMELTSGIPCPPDGNNLSYFLEFDMSKAKPGCTQQWFAVNFDSLASPTNFIPFDQGVLAPPPPGSPIPFAFPYVIVGSRGVKFVKAYTAGEIGNDPAYRKPNGSFTVGLIIGNGKPNPGGPPSCLDTAWYHDMFRILYLNADFTIVSPTQEIKAVCAGGTAYFMLAETIQDSIKTLRWNWGYQGIGRGVDLATYIEQYEYYQPYTGPSPTRNDKDVVYNGENWLYNYIIRQNLSDVLGLEIIDTVVVSILKDWQIVADTRAADDIVEDAFEAIGLYMGDIPPEDLPLYLGDGSVGCVDTTGMSQYFSFGIKPYSEKLDPLVYRDGDRRYRYTDSNMNSSIEVAHILHFRDSSIRGYDSLALDTNGDGTDDMLRGLWKYTYRHPKIVEDPCEPGKFDTIYVNSNGPMLPSLFLNNTVGCQKRGAALLNVGFLNDFWLIEDRICNGLAINVYDTLRYWQYGDDMFPDDYPIDPRPFWQDRYHDQIEIYEADWDKSDGLGTSWERSIDLSHVYTAPGTYTITLHSIDSINCHDTVELTAYITAIDPDFETTSGLDNCNTFVDFLHTSVIHDPCLISSGCDNPEPCDSVIAFEWDFGDGTRKSLLKNPTHSYTKGGWFDVTLKVWTVLGCHDSITKSIYIPGPRPEFEFMEAEWNNRDSAVICVGDSIVMRNISGGDQLDPSWEMRWGDGKVSNPQDSGTTFGNIYTETGTFYLYMVQFDEIPGSSVRCSRIFPDTNPDLINQRYIKVVVLPRAPAELEIVDTIVCPGEVTEFIAHVDQRYERYTWNFNNDRYGDDDDTARRNYPDSIVPYSYDSSGLYTVQLIPEYDTPPFIPTCSDTAEAFIRVIDVFASFAVDSTLKPEFCFKNESTGDSMVPSALTYEWTFEDEPVSGTSGELDPCYNWSDRVGDWEVCLTVTNGQGCKDDTCLIIPNRFQRQLVPYNVFTPGKDMNGDGLNDNFVIDGKGIEVFEIKIYNRWGEKVFESRDLNYSWNGNVNNDGVECPSGTYYYVINYQFKFEEENEGLGPIEGMVELIRQ